jgi:uncharacterized protein
MNQNDANFHQIQSVLDKASVCRLALSVGDQPYLVPVCFGFSDSILYFHSGPGGKKLEMLAENSRVCFEFEADVEVIPNLTPCQFSMRYRSLIGYGQAVLVEDITEKRAGLDAIIRQYGGVPGDYGDAALAGVEVYAVRIDWMTYKQHNIEE